MEVFYSKIAFWKEGVEDKSSMALSLTYGLWSKESRFVSFTSTTLRKKVLFISVEVYEQNHGFLLCLIRKTKCANKDKDILRKSILLTGN